LCGKSQTRDLVEFGSVFPQGLTQRGLTKPSRTPTKLCLNQSKCTPRLRSDCGFSGRFGRLHERTFVTPRRNVFLRIKCDDAVSTDISGGHHKVRNSNYQLFVQERVLFFVFFVFFSSQPPLCFHYVTVACLHISFWRDPRVSFFPRHAHINIDVSRLFQTRDRFSALNSCVLCIHPKNFLAPSQRQNSASAGRQVES
jgi:hypothetical protein